MSGSVIQGHKASPGVGLGYAFVIDSGRTHQPFPKKSILNILDEIERFNSCLSISKSQLEGVREKIIEEFGEDYGYLVEAQLMALEDHHWIEDVRDRIRQESLSAECAIVSAFEEIYAIFSKMEDSYFKERFSDIRVVERRLLANLTSALSDVVEGTKDHVILIAKTLSPLELIRFTKVQIRGIVLSEGGAMSHLSILCRAMGIPCVIGVDPSLLKGISGKRCILNGDTGEVTIDPEDHLWEGHQKASASLALDRRDPIDSDFVCETLDGQKVKLFANVDFFDEVSTVQSHGADGIGLLRTETLFLGKEFPPDEDYQREVYSKILESCSPKEVVIRLFDIDANHLEGDYLFTKRNDQNPALGLRGIRFLMKNAAILRSQIRSILRSTQESISILVPMVSSVSQIRYVSEAIAAEKGRLEREGVEHVRSVRLGAMIEVPSAALTTGVIAKEVDFLSIGTNDLVQYALGVDRENISVSDLYDPMHPAVLGLIQTIVNAARDHQIPVGICGEMASDPLYAPVLVGLGVDFLSTHPYLLGEIRQSIGKVSAEKAQRWVQKLLSSGTPEDARKLLLEWATPRPGPVPPKFS